MQQIFIAGCGYIGERIARLCQESGGSATCMVRSAENASRLQSAGFTAIAATLDNGAETPPLNLGGRILFYLIPPPGGGISDSRTRNFIGQIQEAEKPVKIVYMSATSVYDGVSGAVITEESPVNPDSAMGKRRLDAERAFAQYGAARNIPVVILRVSGIYGPGRLPLMQISEGQPLLREEESGPSNRIHADDLAAICIKAAEKGVGGDIFNISDGHPSSMTSYFNVCADALGFPRQPQVTLAQARMVMSPLMLSYVSQTRVIDNRRMLDRLKVKLRYDALSDGLAASLPGIKDRLPKW